MTFPLNSIGQYVKNVDLCSSESSSAPSVITAAGGLDNVKVTGQTIDRKQSDGAMAGSVAIATSYLAALTDTKTVSLAHEIQYSSDGSTWDTAVEIEELTVKATSDGGTNERGCDEHAVDLMAQKQYFRVNVTLDLSHSGTDTATFHSVGTLGGFSIIPQ